MNSLLPSELLELIFSYLSKNEICKCMRVCRLWYKVASMKRYEEIYAYPLYWSCMQNFQSNRIDGSKAGDLVKVCSFAKWEEHSEQNFQDLINILPNLKIIKGMSEQCVQSLNNRNLLERLPRLEEVLIDDNCIWYSGIGELLLALNIQLKDQITSFTIKNLSSHLWGDYTNLLTNLSGFSNLKYLCISRTVGRGNRAINLTSILNACSSLESLELYSRYKWEIDTTENVVHTSLSSLKLTRSYLSENHIKYMTQHIPNLNSFSLLVLKNTFKGTLATSNPSIVSDFAIYLKGIKYLEIQRSEMTIARANGPNAHMDEVSVFWRFLRELCNKDCYCDLQAHVFSPNAHSSDTYLEKKNQHIYLKCDILWDLSNYNSWTQQLDFFTFSSIEVCSSQEDYTMHYNWMQSLITLLKQQQHKQVCPINIRHAGQKVQFGSTLPTERRSIVKEGLISSELLESEMLKEFGQLYPHIETLVIDHCRAEREDNKAYTHQFNLSHFEELQEFKFNLNRIAPENGPGTPWYVVTPVDYFNCWYNKTECTIEYQGQYYKFISTRTFFCLEPATQECLTFKAPLLRNIVVIS